MDDYSRYSVVQFLEYKSEVTEVVQRVLTALETQSNTRVRCVRSDNGGEYVNHALAQWFTSKGIVHQTTTAYTPQQNGAAERLNRTLLSKARAMLAEAKLPPEYWAEAAYLGVPSLLSFPFLSLLGPKNPSVWGARFSP